MPKSFIKIKPVSANSERHNQRLDNAYYLIPGSAENVNLSNQSVQEKRTQLEMLVKEKTGRKMQKKATPIREAVVLLPDDDNDFNTQALFKLTDELKERFGIDCFQWHIHNDEGHFSEEEGKYKYNYHAHLVFDWIDHESGKSFKLSKEDMSEMQSITSEILEMERGLKGSKNMSLNHHEYRQFIEIRNKLEKEIKAKLSEEQTKKIREELIQKRNENANERRKSPRISR